MNIKLNRKNNAVHFEAVNENGNSVQVDGAPKIGGENNGARPMELVIMGLGACSSMDVVTILQKQKQEITDYSVDINADRDTENIPSLFTTIHLKFTITGKVDLKKAEKAVKLSMDKYCSVSKILEKTATITHEVIVINE